MALLGANLGPRGWNCHCDSYWQQPPHLPICSLYPHTTLSLGAPRPVPSRPHRQPFQPWSLLPIPPSFPPGGHPVQGPSGQLLCLLLTELPLGPAGSGVAAVGRHLPVPPPTSPVAVCPNLGPERGMAKSGGVASQGRTGGWKTTGSWRGGSLCWQVWHSPLSQGLGTELATTQPVLAAAAHMASLDLQVHLLSR